MKIVAVIMWLGYVYVVIRRCATESLGEIRYCLKCAKERKDVCCKNNPNISPDMVKVLEADIQKWENKLQKHWGQRLANGKVSKFDTIPTPEDGKYLEDILEKVKKYPNS